MWVRVDQSEDADDVEDQDNTPDESPGIWARLMLWLSYKFYVAYGFANREFSGEKIEISTNEGSGDDEPNYDLKGTIVGVGDAHQAKLLAHGYRTVQDVAAADPEDIALCGIPRSTAKRIVENANRALSKELQQDPMDHIFSEVKYRIILSRPARFVISSLFFFLLLLGFPYDSWRELPYGLYPWIPLLALPILFMIFSLSIVESEREYDPEKGLDHWEMEPEHELKIAKEVLERQYPTLVATNTSLSNKIGMVSSFSFLLFMSYLIFISKEDIVSVPYGLQAISCLILLGSASVMGLMYFISTKASPHVGSDLLTIMIHDWDERFLIASDMNALSNSYFILSKYNLNLIRAAKTIGCLLVVSLIPMVFSIGLIMFPGSLNPPENVEVLITALRLCMVI